MVLDVLFFQYQPIIPEKGAVNVPSDFDKVAFNAAEREVIYTRHGALLPDGRDGRHRDRRRGPCGFLTARAIGVAR